MRILRRGARRIRNMVRNRYDMFLARRQLMPDLFDGDRIGRYIGQALIPISLLGFGIGMNYRNFDKVRTRVDDLGDGKRPRGF